MIITFGRQRQEMMKSRTKLAIIGILVGLYSQHLVAAIPVRIDWDKHRIRVNPEFIHRNAKANRSKKSAKSKPYRSNGVFSFFREVQNEIKVAQQRNDILRIGSEVLVSVYGAMMLRGGMALQSLFCSMASIILIFPSNFECDFESRNEDSVSLSCLSLFLSIISGSATICSWLFGKFT